MNSQLTKAVAVGGTRVSLTYSDGLIRILDLAEVVCGPIFEPWKDPVNFAEFRVEFDTIRWPNGADIDPDVLRLWAEQGRVLNQAETDAWFSERAAQFSVA